MIHIGLAGWGDHDDLYPDKAAAKNKLYTYSRYFPIVEVDSSFYAVQPQKNYAKWAGETPDSFGFVVKAYQGMTGHLRGKPVYATREEMFTAFCKSMQPIVEAGKLRMVLFQYPPWFDCTRGNVAELRDARERMGDLPCALEFRHQSWYAEDRLEQTIAFTAKERWIHTVCDEPQVMPGSVPFVLRATDDKQALVRFHGRHVMGWTQSGNGNWREVRYLYRYSRDELMEAAGKLKELEKMSEEVCVIFNNNSGGDAASNAAELQAILRGSSDEPISHLPLQRQGTRAAQELRMREQLVGVEGESREHERANDEVQGKREQEQKKDQPMQLDLFDDRL